VPVTPAGRVNVDDVDIVLLVELAQKGNEIQ
jgi:hypothetical protein